MFKRKTALSKFIKLGYIIDPYTEYVDILRYNKDIKNDKNEVITVHTIEFRKIQDEWVVKAYESYKRAIMLDRKLINIINQQLKELETGDLKHVRSLKYKLKGEYKI